MIHSGRAARHARMYKRHRREEELNLISLIDIFSVLVFFLIVNFGDMSVLDIALPAASAEPIPEIKDKLKLEVVVRAAQIDVSNDGDLLTTIPDVATGHDYVRLSEYLARVKVSKPDARDARLLLEPETPYDAVVQTMDTLRIKQQMVDGTFVRSELFPEIALGDAPALSR